MITIAVGIIGTITIGMIGTITIETTATTETNEFFIYSGSEKNQNKDEGDQGEVGNLIPPHLSTVPEFSLPAKACPDSRRPPTPGRDVAPHKA